jgi:hypothetical protein
METIHVTYNNIYKFWDVAKGNPIKSIHFEHHSAEYNMQFVTKTIVFKHNPDVIYTKTDPWSSDDYDTFEDPIKEIESILPYHLHDKIVYFYNALGIFVALKGDLSMFPISEILNYFDIEFLDSNKLGLSYKCRPALKEDIFKYLHANKYNI